MRHDTELPATPIDADPGAAPVVDHPLEVAAKRGFGPLSEYSSDVWHGGGVPCVTCAQLVRRGATMCDACGQDLSPEMIQKMRAHAGPWYVYEHVRPFPGVSLDRIIRQIHRGLITETSIVRGPTTDYQWRFAVETPGLCRYFQHCWQCHAQVSASDANCPQCLSSLSFDRVAASGLSPILRDAFGSSKAPPATPPELSPPAGVFSAPLTSGSLTPAARADLPQPAVPDHRATSGSVAWPEPRSSPSAVRSDELDRLRAALRHAGPAPDSVVAPKPEGLDRPAAPRRPVPVGWIIAATGMLAVIATILVAKLLHS